MTVLEAIEAALAEVALHTDKVPGSRTPLIRRLSTRQQQLFALAAAENPEYFRICATTRLFAGKADLNAMYAAGIQEIERLLKIEVATKGTSALENGDKITVVPFNDEDVGFAPRVTVANHVVAQVAGDLDGVEKITLWYSRRPHALTTVEQEIELPRSFQDLLVIDLALYLLRRFLPVMEKKHPTIALLEKEEGELLAGFVSHLKGYVANLESRFDDPYYAPGA